MVCRYLLIEALSLISWALPSSTSELPSGKVIMFLSYLDCSSSRYIFCLEILVSLMSRFLEVIQRWTLDVGYYVEHLELLLGWFSSLINALLLRSIWYVQCRDVESIPF